MINSIIYYFSIKNLFINFKLLPSKFFMIVQKFMEFRCINSPTFFKTLEFKDINDFAIWVDNNFVMPRWRFK